MAQLVRSGDRLARGGNIDSDDDSALAEDDVADPDMPDVDSYVNTDDEDSQDGGNNDD